MTFWGCELAPGQQQPVEVQEGDVLHLSRVCLHEPADGQNFLQVEIAGVKYTLACLKKGTREHDSVNLRFAHGQTVVFAVSGQSGMHLTGFLRHRERGLGQPGLVKVTAKSSKPAVVASFDAAASVSASPRGQTGDGFVEATVAASPAHSGDKRNASEHPLFDYIVAGAGGIGSCTDGTYSEVGTHNGMPKYKQNGGDAIIYFCEMWNLNYKDDMTGWYYCRPGYTAGQPPLGAWTTEGYTGSDANPPPTLQRIPTAAATSPLVPLAKRAKRAVLSSADAPAEVQAVSNFDSGAYSQQLVDYLQAHGKKTIAFLGCKVQRPKGAPKLKQFLEQHGDRFVVSEDSVDIRT